MRDMLNNEIIDDDIDEDDDDISTPLQWDGSQEVTLEYMVDDNDNGCRIDKFLSQKQNELSRSYIQK